MKLDAKKGDRGALYDADGVAVPHFFTADTETGVVVYPLKVDGAYVRRGSHVAKICKRFKAPLRWEPLP